jgi:hypothetical protein
LPAPYIKTAKGIFAGRAGYLTDTAPGPFELGLPSVYYISPPDPEHLNYTLGKLMINKLRGDWTAGRGGEEAWGQFHDEFLGFGSPPIPLIGDLMLNDEYEGDTALLPH